MIIAKRRLLSWLIYKNQVGNLLGVFAIVINTTDQEWRDFVRNYRMDRFVNVFDPTNRAIYGKYYVDNTPEIYLLNRDREIIAKNLKVFQIQEMINRDQASGD